MDIRLRIWSGPLMGAAFIVATLLLPPLIPGYSLARQTVSEIGGLGAPMHWPFSGFLAGLAILTVAFGSALRQYAAKSGLPRWPAYLLWLQAVCYLGLAAFPTPQPLHNLFGILQVFSYGAMAAVAWGWRKDSRLGALPRLSGVLYAIFLILFLGSIAWTISALHNPSQVKLIVATQGLAQRAYIYTLHLWAIALGLKLLAIEHPSEQAAAT